MANINFSLSALVGKHITFTVPLDLAVLSISNCDHFYGCIHQLSGTINGFSMCHDTLEVLVNDEYYDMSNVQILSISDNLERA